MLRPAAAKGTSSREPRVRGAVVTAEQQTPRRQGGRWATAALLTVLMLAAVALTGCGVVNDVRKVVHTVDTDRATIDAFTEKLKASKISSFEATYVTMGASHATVIYAVEPPRELAFKSSAPTSSGIGAVDIVANSSGEYACSDEVSSGSSGGPTCDKLAPLAAADENKIFSFYTSEHWIAFLRGFSLVAGLAGDSIGSSRLTVNGFPMQCVDFRAKGAPGISKICTTADGILGYVKVASSSTSFEIKSFTTSPPTSTFALPAGAKITAIRTASR